MNIEASDVNSRLKRLISYHKDRKFGGNKAYLIMIFKSEGDFEENNLHFVCGQYHFSTFNLLENEYLIRTDFYLSLLQHFNALSDGEYFQYLDEAIKFCEQ